jgi:hypothetical protein
MAYEDFADGVADAGIFGGFEWAGARRDATYPVWL